MDRWVIVVALGGILLGDGVILISQTRDTRTPRTPTVVATEIGKLEHVQRDAKAAADYLRGALDALRWQQGAPGAAPPSQIIQADGLGVGTAEGGDSRLTLRCPPGSYRTGPIEVRVP